MWFKSYNATKASVFVARNFWAEIRFFFIFRPNVFLIQTYPLESWARILRFPSTNHQNWISGLKIRAATTHGMLVDVSSDWFHIRHTNPKALVSFLLVQISNISGLKNYTNKTRWAQTRAIYCSHPHIKTNNVNAVQYTRYTVSVSTLTKNKFITLCEINTRLSATILYCNYVLYVNRRSFGFHTFFNFAFNCYCVKASITSSD